VFHPSFSVQELSRHPKADTIMLSVVQTKAGIYPHHVYVGDFDALRVRLEGLG
jgi:hypothetical protein